MTDCAYLQEGKCLHHEGQMPNCESCPDALRLSQSDFAEKWVDPLVVVDRRKVRTEALHDLLAKGAAFLICGGPSANDLPLEHLGRKGIFSLAVNNVAAHPHIKPQAFVCSDPPSKFSPSIWLDKGMMKFVPSPKLRARRGKLRKKNAEGKFEQTEIPTIDCPNVWGFQRHSWLSPDDQFFLTEGACWGNHKAGSEKTGQPRTVCTMLLGLRLLYYLGARRIYLVGVDFHMAPDYGYSFPQGRTPEASNSNNSQFKTVNSWLCGIERNGTFKRFGLEVYNCFENSGLRAFPYVPFENAVEDVRGDVEDDPDLVGWYDPKDKGK